MNLPRLNLVRPCSNYRYEGTRHGCAVLGQCAPASGGQAAVSACPQYVQNGVQLAVPPSTMLGNCAHLGRETGRLVECPSCKGTVQLKVIGCAVHGECTVGRKHGDMACCAGCNDRDRANVPFERQVVQLPGDAVGYNPSITRWQGRLLMCWRDKAAGSNLFIGELHLSSKEGERHRVAEASMLQLAHPLCRAGREDPRLFVHRGQLHLQFSGVELRRGLSIPRVHVLHARLTGDLRVERVWEPLLPGRAGWEKNWAPFELGDHLYSVYYPRQHGKHRVIKHTGESSEMAAEVAWDGWQWGDMRGGAPPVKVGGEFWHFFHGYDGGRYNVGAYAFSASPPFGPTRMVELPLVWPRQGEHIAFPCGALRDGDGWLVSWGEQDKRCVVGRFKHSDLEQQMKTIGEVSFATKSIECVERSYITTDAFMGASVIPKKIMLPPIYCITCSQTHDRKPCAEAHFADRGLGVTMVQGVHGKTWGIAAPNAPTADEMTPGHIGLNLSHWMLWQALWLTGDEEALVLEDDCIFQPDFAERFAEVRTELPEDWQLCFVGSVGMDGKQRSRISQRLCRVAYPYGTHCYLVRRSALPILIETMQQVRKHVDQQLWENVLRDGKLNWYCAWPSLVGQRTFSGEWKPSTLD